MNLFTVDQEKCTSCSACVAECPINIITMKPDAIPEPAPHAEELCINCGHCVSVCANAALSLERMPVTECPPINKEWLLNPDQAEHCLRSRRSIRTYKTQPVDKNTIQKLIEIARYAPSGHNSQPLSWRVIHDSAEVKRYSGLIIDWMKSVIAKSPNEAKMMNFDRHVDRYNHGVDSVLRDAPHIVICHAHMANPFAPSAATLALGYMELAALPLGLGACWAGFINFALPNWPPLVKALELPEGHVYLGSLMVGYPKYKYHRLPKRNTPVISWR